MVCSNRNTMSCVGHCVLLKLWWMGKCSEEIKRMIRGFKKINYEERLKSTDTTVRPLLVIFECWWWLKEVPDDWEKAAVTCFWKRAGRMIKWTIGHSVSLHSQRITEKRLHENCFQACEWQECVWEQTTWIYQGQSMLDWLPSWMLLTLCMGWRKWCMSFALEQARPLTTISHYKHVA